MNPQKNIQPNPTTTPPTKTEQLLTAYTISIQQLVKKTQVQSGTRIYITDNLAQILTQLETITDIIIESDNSVQQSSSSPPQHKINRNSPHFKTFYGKNTKNLLRVILKIRQTQEIEVVRQIYNIIRCLLRLFCHEIDYDNLQFSENAKEIFCVDNLYYSYPYNTLDELDSGGLEQEFWVNALKKAVSNRDLDKLIAHEEGKYNLLEEESTGDQGASDSTEISKGGKSPDSSCNEKSPIAKEKNRFTISEYEKQLNEEFNLINLQAWYDSLGHGIVVDALKIDQQYRACSWSRARLKYVKKENHMRLEFLNDSEIRQQDILMRGLENTVLSSSAEIAPIGTRCLDFDWRENLKEGDIVDCYDTANVWYRSTILKKLTKVTSLGNVKKHVLVAFRIYVDNGPKTDNDGRKYMGWHSKYDEEMSVHNPRIQKPNYMSKIWTDHSSARGFNDDTSKNEDNDDIGRQFGCEEIDDQLFALIRKNSLKSKIVVALINYFGRLGGYSKLLRRIQNKQYPTSFQLLSHYTQIIGGPKNLYSKRFVMKYVNMLRTSIPQQTMAMMQIPKLIRELQKQRMEKLLESYSSLLRRIYVNEDRAYYFQRLSLDLHLMWIKSEFMDKRIFGLKHLQEYSRKARLYRQQALESDELIQWIIQHKIIEQIFNPIRTHQQLIKRSLQILKLFSHSNHYSSSTHQSLFNNTNSRNQGKKKIEYEKDPFQFILQQMWVCVQYNNQYKAEIYKVIKQAQQSFNSDQNEIIVQKLANIQIDNMIIKDVQLITEMIKTQSKLSDSSISCAKKLWAIAFRKQAGKQLRQTAIKNIGDVLKTYEWRKHRLQYINDCVQLIKDKKFINTVMKIFEKLLDSYSTLKTSQPSMYENYQRYNLIQMLDKEQGLTQAIFDEFTLYYETLIKQTSSSNLVSQTFIVSDDDTTHRQSIEARIKFIKFIYSNSLELKITYEQIQLLWTMMMEKSPIESDRDLLLKLFKQEADHVIKPDSSSVMNMTSTTSVENEPILHIDDLIKIYRDVIGNIKKNGDGEEQEGGGGNTFNLAYIRDEGFKFLQSLFIYVNEKQSRLIRVEQKKVYQNTTYYGHAYTHTSSESDKSSSEIFFKVYTHPNTLEGIEIFWRIMLDANDGEYASRAQNIIIRAFTSLTFEIQEKSHSLYRELTDQCMKLLQKLTITSSTSSATPPRKEITRILQMITAIMRESQRNGVGSVRPHSGLLRERVITLKIHNNCTTTKQIPKTFFIRLYSNTTVSQIRNELSKILRTTAKDLKIIRTRGNIDVDEHDNAKTLNDMEFEQTSESLILSRRASYSAQHTPILNLSKNLTTAAKKIFTQWFHEYSDFTNEQTGQKLLSRKGAAQFTSSCTHQKCYQNDSRISTLFSSFNIQKNGHLTLQNFLQFYRQKALTHDHVVWNNLNYKGYGSDLTKGSEGGKKVVQQDLPRVFIVQNLDYFKLLFKVQQNTDIQISNAAWSLINQLATSQVLYQQILKLDVDRDQQIGMLKWDELIPTQNAAQLLYTLQIIEFFIEEPPSLGQASMQIFDQDNKKQQQQQQQNDNKKRKSDNQHDLDEVIQQQQQATPTTALNKNDEMKAVRFTDLQSAIGGSDSKYKTPPPPSQKSSGGRRKKNRMLKAQKYQYVSQKAIPLPDAQTVETDAYVQQQQGEQKSSNNNDNNNNNNDNKKDNNKDDSQQNIPVWTYSGISANADLVQLSARKEWRLKFFQQSGFSHLFEMLMERKFYSNERLLDTKSSQTKFVLKGLGSLIRIIKIYLTAALSASSESVHDVVAMVRRSSSANQFQDLAKQVVDDKKEVEKQQEEKVIEKMSGNNGSSPQVVQFQELISQLRGSAAQELLMLVNFKKFQNQIINILATIVNGRKDMNFEERSIIESGLSLWVNCMVFRPSELFQSFITEYGDKKNRDLPSTSPLYSSQAFILETLFTYKSHLVRKEFMMTYYTICKSIPLDTEMEVHPLVYFLKLLIASIPREYNILRRECKDFYELLRLLIEQYYQQQKSSSFYTKQSSQIIDADSLIIQVLDSFHQYQPKQKRNTVIQDQTLIGFLQLLKTIAEKSPKALRNKHGEQLLIEAYKGCLFPSQFKELSSDVTEQQDLTSSALTPNKCKTKQSRQAAFQLLHSLSVISIPMMSELLDMLYDTIKRAPTQTSWGYSPSNKNRSTEGYVGIQNLGCICYMIAMLQQFYMIPPLRYNILQTDDNVAPDMKEYKGRLEDDNIIHQLQRMFCNLQLSEKRAYNPIGFCFAFKDYEGNPTNTGVQQDAQQFLNMAFDRFENLLKGTRSKYLLPCVFGGSFCQQLTCKSCKFVRTNYQSFYNLSLEVKDIPGLYKSLDKFIVGETIQDYLCEECQQKAQVTKRTSIASLPNVLIIHLQRIVFNFDTFNNDKISTRFEFPKTLDLKKYTLDHINQQEFNENQKKQQQSQQEQEQAKYQEVKQEQEKKIQKQQKKSKNQPTIIEEKQPQPKQFKTYQQDPCYEYKLVGVVVHQGSSAEHGHYISFINTQRGDPSLKINRYSNYNYLATENDKWLEFNDQTVRHFSFSSLQSECFGSNSFSSSSSSSFSDEGYYAPANGPSYSDIDSKRCAYMLVYERVRKKDIKLALTKQQADIVLKKQSDMKQKLQKEKSLLQKFKIQQRLEKYHQSDPIKITFNQQEKQYVQEINFYSVPRFVPKQKANEIWKENNEFLFFEYYLYSQEFFDFIMILADKCWSKIQNLEEEVKMQMEKNDSDIKMLDQSQDNSFTVITPEASQQILRKLMHICNIGVFRLLARTTNNNQIVSISNTLCKILGKDGALAQEFMNECILNAEGSLGSATFVHELLLQSPDKQTRSNVAKIIAACVNSLFQYEAAYLFETQVIGQNSGNSDKQKTTVPKALCIRYMNIIISMIRKGEIVKNWTRFQDFFAFIAEIAKAGQIQREFMIKNQFIALLLDMYLGPNSPLCPPHIKRDSIGNQYAKPNFSQMFTSLTHLLNGLEEKSLTEQKNDSTLQLSQADKVCLLNKSFFKKAIKQSKQVAGQLVPLIVLQCRDNLDNSKTIAKILLRSLNQTDFQAVSGILQILEPFILIDDQYQLNRLEWIFGFPQPNIRSGIVQSQYEYKGSTTAGSLPFLGVSHNPSFLPQAHTYNTSLSKFSSLQSFTSVVFSKRIRQQTCAMFMLLSIWKMMLMNEVFRDYILSLPPANYDYGSFHDYWMKVVNAYIADTKKYTHKSLRNTAGCMAESLVEDVEKNINQWKEKQIDLIENKEQRDRVREVNNLIHEQYDGAMFKRPYSFDYVICRVTGQKKIQQVTKEREFNEDDIPSDAFSSKNYNNTRYSNNNKYNNNNPQPQFVSMVITQYQGEILTPSLPNGNKNLSIEQYQRGKGITSSSSSGSSGILGNSRSGMSGAPGGLFLNKLSRSKKAHEGQVKSLKKNKSGQRKKKQQQQPSTFPENPHGFLPSSIHPGTDNSLFLKQFEEQSKQQKKWKQQQFQKSLDKSFNSDQANVGSDYQDDLDDVEFDEYKQLIGSQNDKDNSIAPQQSVADEDIQKSKNQNPQSSSQKPTKQVIKSPIQRTKQFKFTRATSMQKGEAPPIISIIQSQPQNVYQIAEKQAGLNQEKIQQQEDKKKVVQTTGEVQRQQNEIEKKITEILRQDDSKQDEDKDEDQQWKEQQQDQQQEQSSEEQENVKEKEIIEGQLLRNITFLYRVSFYNGTNETQKVKYSIKPKHPNRNQNIWLPVNEFSCLVTERYQRHVFHLIKKDPFNNIPEENEFQVIWRIEDHNEASKSRKKAKKQVENFSHLLFPIQQNQNTVGDNDGNNATETTDVPDLGVENPPPAPKGMKSCRLCTMFIAESAKRCQVCDTLQ